MTAIRIVPAPAGADEHPSQADEALRRAREADRRNGQQGRPTHLTTTVDDAAFWSIVGAAQADACPICGRWSCNRAGCAGGTAPAGLAVLVPVGGSGQCNICGGWFDDWAGGTCDACRNNGY